MHIYSNHHRGWKSNHHSFCPYFFAASLHSGATILLVPCKKKDVAPDTSVTASERLSIFSLIENVDMGKLIDDLMKTKVIPLAYRHIQEFITKVWVMLFYFNHLFHETHILLFKLFFASWSKPYLTKRQAKGSHRH